MTKYNFTGRINYSGLEFQDEFNGFQKNLPTWEQVSTPIQVEIVKGKVVSSEKELAYYDKKAIEFQFKELLDKGQKLLERLNNDFDLLDKRGELFDIRTAIEQTI